MDDLFLQKTNRRQTSQTAWRHHQVVYMTFTGSTCPGLDDSLCRNKIQKVKGRIASYNVEDYGLALAEAHGAGYDVQRFEEESISAESLPSYMWNAAEAICSKMNWTIKDISQKSVPYILDEECSFRDLGSHYPGRSGNWYVSCYDHPYPPRCRTWKLNVSARSTAKMMAICATGKSPVSHLAFRQQT